MVDKLSFVKSPRSLRRSFKIFPMLCPILIGHLFHQGFHTNDGLDFLSAHGHGPVRPVRPRLLFLSPSGAITNLIEFNKYGSNMKNKEKEFKLLFAKYAILGDTRKN